MEQVSNDQKPKRGFAAMNADRQREIASSGGRAAHQQGVAHEWTKQEAQDAGKKGGHASGQKRKVNYNEDRPLL